jgi:hypothetical protein
VDVDEFWVLLERSARETMNLRERTGWLEYRLGRVSGRHVVDFQAHLNAERRPIDTYAMWGAYQIMDCVAMTRLVLAAVADRAGAEMVRARRPPH